MARRVSLGLARTGTTRSHSSGDIFLAVSTANPGGFTGGDPLGSGGEGYDSLTFVPWGKINPFFEAVVQATEEAVANALIANEDMTGRDGHRSPAARRRLTRSLAAKPSELIGKRDRDLLNVTKHSRARHQTPLR
jgi:L-aminopeptidase/D-esterase-like protein